MIAVSQEAFAATELRARQEVAQVTTQFPPKNLQRHRRAPIDPAVKSWIDNVMVPALVERWAKREQPRDC